MDKDLKTIVSGMTEKMAAWLDQPGPEAQKIAEIRQGITEAKGMMGAGFLAGTLRELERADVAAKRVRQRQASEAVATLCRELGVMLDPKEPPKRAKRKPGAKKKAKEPTAEVPQAPAT